MADKLPVDGQAEVISNFLEGMNQYGLNDPRLDEMYAKASDATKPLLDLCKIIRYCGQNPTVEDRLKVKAKLESSLPDIENPQFLNDYIETINAHGVRSQEAKDFYAKTPEAGKPYLALIDLMRLSCQKSE